MRWNRDYSVKVTWMYELNKDLYDCYVEADRSVYGYSGCMKTLWDARHPEYSHMTAKHLTTQISRIQKKKLILESTQNSTQTETERTIVSQKDNSGTNHQKETETLVKLLMPQVIPEFSPTSLKNKKISLRMGKNWQQIIRV